MLLLFDDENIKIFNKCREKLRLLRKYSEESEKWITEKYIEADSLEVTQNLIVFFIHILFDGTIV